MQYIKPQNRHSLKVAFPMKTMSPQRLISNIMNTIFTVFPDLQKKITREQAIQIINIMNTSGMLQCSVNEVNFKDTDNRKRYAKYMIKYEADIRLIAKTVGVNSKVAINFIRGCFNANKCHDIYPYIKYNTNILPTYLLLLKKFGTQITQFIAENIIGESVDNINIHFTVFTRISKSMTQASSVKFFILEGCGYVANHEDQKQPKVPGQGARIFIDEFIDYLIEMDEARYELFKDEIAEILSEINSAFTPDCSDIIEHLQMAKFDEDIYISRKGFSKLLEKSKTKKTSANKTIDTTNNAEIQQFMNIRESEVAQFFKSGIHHSLGMPAAQAYTFKLPLSPKPITPQHAMFDIPQIKDDLEEVSDSDSNQDIDD